MARLIAELNAGESSFDKGHPIQVVTQTGQRFAMTRLEALALSQSLRDVLLGMTLPIGDGKFLMSLNNGG